MSKLIEVSGQLPTWIPFIGLMAGEAGKSPFVTRLAESAITAIVLGFVAVIWAVPKLEAKLEANTAISDTVIHAYAENMKELSNEVKSSNMTINSIKVDVAVLKDNMARVESKVENIDDIANTKVRSVEGRLDSLEREINRK